MDRNRNGNINLTVINGDRDSGSGVTNIHFHLNQPVQSTNLRNNNQTQDITGRFSASNTFPWMNNLGLSSNNQSSSIGQSGSNLSYNSGPSGSSGPSGVANFSNISLQPTNQPDYPPPGLANNRRLNFRNNSRNVAGTLEIQSFGSVNPESVSTQIDQIARNIINSIGGNQTEGGLTLQELRDWTTLSVASNNNDICEICHDTINENDILRTLNICGHHFHQECIDVWLENNSKCPCCRADLLTTPDMEDNDNTISEEKEEKESKNNEESKTN